MTPSPVRVAVSRRRTHAPLLLFLGLSLSVHAAAWVLWQRTAEPVTLGSDTAALQVALTPQAAPATPVQATPTAKVPASTPPIAASTAAGEDFDRSTPVRVASAAPAPAPAPTAEQPPLETAAASPSSPDQPASKPPEPALPTRKAPPAPAAPPAPRAVPPAAALPADPPPAERSRAFAGENGTPVDDTALEARLAAAVRTNLAEHFSYPMLARRNHWEGEVLLSFRVAPDGRIHDIQIARGSGYGTLDQAAMRALRRVDRLSDAGRQLRGRAIELELLVEYRLTRG